MEALDRLRLSRYEVAVSPAAVAPTPAVCYYSPIRRRFRRLFVEFWWKLLSSPVRDGVAPAV
jgi:hypothetical protein